ncbi:MAG: hypothetical protein RIB98_12995 [Acidimicrobiales bacterium]
MASDLDPRARVATLQVALVAFALAVLVSGWILVRNDNDPAMMLAFGVEAPRLVDHAEDVLGRDIPLLSGYGHDGRFFFLQALDPWVLEPDDGPATLLGRPLYRSQRMLLPMVSSGGGLVPDTWLPWTMLLTNLVSIGVGTAATARVAARRGATPWIGLAFAANIGVVIAMGIGAGGVIAFATAMLGIDQIERRRVWPAVAWFAAAALAREAMVFFAFGVALAEWRREGRMPLRFLFVPGAVIAWAGYLRLRLPGGSGSDEVIELGPPFRGFLDAADRWAFGGLGTLDVVLPVLIAIAIAVVVRVAARELDPLAWGAAASAVLVVLLARPVWQNYYDISRAAAPILTAAIVVAFAPRPSDRPVVSDPVGVA